MGELSCAEAGLKKVDGDTRHRMSGGEGGVGSISVHKNKRRSLGT